MHPDNNQPQNNQQRPNDTAERELERSELERAIATYTAVDMAEHNAQLAQERDQAVNLAANQIDDRARAEQEAQAARIAARQSQLDANRHATENTIYRESLASEREAASNASFGFTFLACIVLAALIGLGIWYWTTGSGEPAMETANRPISVNVQSPPQTPPTVIERSSSPVIVQPPPVINVQPAPSTPPPASDNTAKGSAGYTEGGSGSSEAGSGTSDTTGGANPNTSDSNNP